ADDAGLGLAPVAAGDRFAIGHDHQLQPVAGEQGGGIAEADVVQAQDVAVAGSLHVCRGKRGRRGRPRCPQPCWPSGRATEMSSTSWSPSLIRSTLTASTSTLTYFLMTSS